ncbi:hypothetical protein [Clostridium saccharobutylicum]|uniref:Uncharacterized protein n=1 Tax=Clostridium saccharobutylicum TaxID=169679 RepID=A0A1S8N416_CLOSA|nr:hypothetical protein [Clostridium saccharobutylicum]OOM11152.1 hypothetical protein CLOSAC_26950 [Clostridium saccharobutylicum]
MSKARNDLDRMSEEFLRNLDKMTEKPKKNNDLKGFEENVFLKKYKRREFLNNIEGKQTLENVIEFKIKENNIRSTDELAYLIYETIDILYSEICEDKSFFINYINKKILIYINQNSKQIVEEETGEYINLQKRGCLEKHSRYRIVKNMILPVMKVDTNRKSIEYIDQQKKYDRELKSFIKNRGDSNINKLTLTPNILVYMYLCWKRKKSIYNKTYKEILKGNWRKYEFHNLINFYCQLNEFIGNNREYTEYLVLGYEILENIYKGYRINLIIKELESKDINIDDDIIKSKLELYLGILLLINDIDLCEDKIKKFFEYYLSENDNSMEKLVYTAMRYSISVYPKIDKLIEKSVSQIKDIKIKNNDYCNINKYVELFKDKNYNSKKYQDVFKGLEISTEFLYNQNITEKIYDKAKLINRNVKAKDIFTSKGGILYLLLGGYLEYRQYEK